jgi:hypothetical protein
LCHLQPRVCWCCLPYLLWMVGPLRCLAMWAYWPIDKWPIRSHCTMMLIGCRRTWNMIVSGDSWPQFHSIILSLFCVWFTLCYLQFWPCKSFRFFCLVYAPVLLPASSMYVLSRWELLCALSFNESDVVLPVQSIYVDVHVSLIYFKAICAQLNYMLRLTIVLLLLRSAWQCMDCFSAF